MATTSLEEIIARNPKISLLTEKDNAEIVSFFGRVGMGGGGFQLLMQRAPDFFELCRHRGGQSFVYGMRDSQNNLVGVGAMTSMPAHFKNQLGYFVYMGDVRVVRTTRELSQTWKKFLGDLLSEGAHLREVGQPAALMCAIIETNDKARKVFEEKTFGSHKLVSFAPYAMISLLAKKPFRKDRRSQFLGSQNFSLEELETFLDSVHKVQAFGHSFGPPHYELRRRLKDWKNFSLKDFYVVRDQNNQIVAATALWNPNHCKQIVVKGPWWTHIINVFSKIFGWPQFGKPLEIDYLTHLSFSWSLPREQKEEAFGILLSTLWPEKRRRQSHALAFCDFAESSLMKGTQNYWSVSTKTRMYISLPAGENIQLTAADYGKLPMAFEMALA